MCAYISATQTSIRGTHVVNIFIFTPAKPTRFQCYTLYTYTRA
jgi:hypothetical protein